MHLDAVTGLGGAVALNRVGDFRLEVLCSNVRCMVDEWRDGGVTSLLMTSATAAAARARMTATFMMAVECSETCIGGFW